MAAEYPIPATLVRAFRHAIVAADDRWWGDDEPMVVYDHRHHAVGSIAGLVEDFNDPMPDDVCRLLLHAATGHPHQKPTAATFAAGGRCLRAIYDARIERRRASEARA